MALPEVAELFHKLGYNVILYDARSVGNSGGEPRNLIEPLQFAEDLSGECCLWVGWRSAVQALTLPSQMCTPMSHGCPLWILTISFCGAYHLVLLSAPAAPRLTVRIYIPGT